MEKEKMNEEIIRRAVVTGATGAVGMALVKELVGRGIEVLALCRTGSGRAKRLSDIEGVEIKECSLENLDTAGKGCRFFSFGVAGNYGRSAQRRLSSKRKRALCVGRSQRGKAFRV